MEIMQGKTTRCMQAEEFGLLKAAYRDVLLDIGTGDGRFVLAAARRSPNLLAIGVMSPENPRAAGAGTRPPQGRAGAVCHRQRQRPAR